MQLRSKRLRRALDPAAQTFLASVDEDADLLVDDIGGSAAHVHALRDAGVLTADEAGSLLKALSSARKKAVAGDFPLDAAHEDVHMNVEAWLTDNVGDLGKKLHTARSRNDQVALDLRLAARRHLLATVDGLFALVDALETLGQKAPEAVLPGYTHLQPAQPVSFAHWTGLHAERFVRDLGRLRDAYSRLNVNPLGAAALAGTSFPIDPDATARRLGFDAAFRNSLDAVSDRDFLVELASAWAQTAVHASQLAEDVILYASPAYGFLSLGDAHATGSSIMPQKRNPDVFEVVRAAAATATGELVTALTALKGLPSAYNRDLQEQKRVLVTAWRRQRKLLATLPDAVTGLTPAADRMEKAATVGFTDATEVADHLVRQGLPFREAHEKAAELVNAAVEAGTDLAGLDETVVGSILGEHADGLSGVLGAKAARDAKTSPGGTGSDQVKAQREDRAAVLEDLAAFFGSETNRVAMAEAALFPGSDSTDNLVNRP